MTDHEIVKRFEHEMYQLYLIEKEAGKPHNRFLRML